MKIVADENIPFVAEAFASLGDVVTRPGRHISRADLVDAEVLLVRSITPVNANLLDGTRVKYVATATIGMDHLDTAYLEKAGISCCSAPGSNADSVADWFVAAVLTAAQRLEMSLAGSTLGVIGCGNVGSRVVRRAQGLGLTVLENDPPLARTTGDPRYRPLEDLLGADMITMHTPLTRGGTDPSYHLVDASVLERLRPEAVLVNAGRGPCVDGIALKTALGRRRLRAALLDVWENEPVIEPDLLGLVSVATPHIAGYSYDGKVRGVWMIYEQICRWLNVPPTWNPSSVLPPPDVVVLDLDGRGRKEQDVLHEAATAVYPVSEDDDRLRTAIAGAPPSDLGKAFDRLRKEYPRRREFSLTTVRLRNGSARLAAALEGIGFRVEMISTQEDK